MRPLLFQCPSTGMMVQGFLAQEGEEEDANTYVGISCLVCSRMHLIDPKTGKVFAPSRD